MKILIVGPAQKLKNKGGVANHIWGLKDHWRQSVSYIAVGNRSVRHAGRGKWWLFWDVPKFIARLLWQRPDCVCINPSMNPNALRRDFLFMRIANALHFKTAVFVHGFNHDNFAKADKRWLRDNFNRATFVMVLARDFKERLRGIGVTVPIELTTTKVEDSLLDGFDPAQKDYAATHTLLYLARVEKPKGIYETVDTFALLKKEFPALKLQISGDGSELPAVREYVRQHNIADVYFTGLLDDAGVSKAFRDSLMLLLPSYTEGMPTNVLEAMSFALPVVTRPVGGLVDFFEDGRMGVMADTLSPRVFAHRMRPLLADRSLARATGLYNAGYARRHFLASAVASQVESLFEKNLPGK